MPADWACGLFSCIGRGKSARDDEEAHADQTGVLASNSAGHPVDHAATVDKKARTPAARTDADGVPGNDHDTAKARSSGAGIGPSSAALLAAQVQPHGKPSSMAPQASVSTRHAEHASMQRQERTLRAILHKAKQLAAAATEQHRAIVDGMASPQASQEVKASDPELARLRDQLLKACAGTGSDALTRVQQLLLDARRWVQLSGSLQAASMLLSVAEEALMSVETLLTRSGPISQWGPDEVSAALALLQLYSQLAQHALVPHASAAPLRRAVRKLLLGRPVVLGLLLDLLPHVHFSQDYLAGCGAKHEALGAALVLWELLHGLVRFAARVLGPLPAVLPSPLPHASDQAPHQDGRDADRQSGGSGGAQQQAVLTAAVQGLAGLLEPGSGCVPRLLDQPLTEHTAAVQLAVIQMLRHLLEFGGAQLLEAPGLARHYASLHFGQFCHFFAAAGVDTGSAAAELARMHLKVLRAMAACGSPAVRAQLRELRVVGWLLDEFSLESTLLCAEQAEAAAAHAASEEDGDESSCSDGASSDDEDGASDGSAGEARAGSRDGMESPARLSPHPGGLVSAQHPSPHAHGNSREQQSRKGAEKGREAEAGGRAFRFTYDLNEDCERLMALEEQLGRSVDLDGLEYDEEARRLMARDVLAEAAAAKTATEGTEAGTGTGSGSSGSPQAQDPHPAAHPFSHHPTIARLNLGHRHEGPGSLHMGQSSSRSSHHVALPSTPGSSLPSGRTSVEPSRPSIPKLSLTSVRSAASSHVFAAASSPVLGGSSVHPGVHRSVSRTHSHLAPRSSHSSTGHIRSTSSGEHKSCGPTLAPEAGEAQEQQQVLTGRPSRPLLAPLPLSASTGRPLGPLSPPRLPRLPTARLHHSHMSPLSSRVDAGAGHVPTSARVGDVAGGLLGAGHVAVGSQTARPATSVCSSTVAGQGVEPSFSSKHSNSSAMAGGVLSVQAGVRHSETGMQQAPDEGGEERGRSSRGPELRLQLPHGLVPAGSAANSARGNSRAASGMPVPALNLGVLSSARNRGGAPGTGSGAQSGSGANAGSRQTEATEVLSSMRALNTGTTIADSAGDPRHAPQLSPGAHALGSGPGPLGSGARDSPVPTYEQAVASKLWFHDASLHVGLLQQLLDLLLLPGSGSLDPEYVPAFPADAGAPNVEHLLAWHFAGPAGSRVLPQLVRAVTSAAGAVNTGSGSSREQQDVSARARGQGGSAGSGAAAAAGTGSGGTGFSAPADNSSSTTPPALRLLRLLSRALFDPSRLHDLVFYSRGAYGGIFRAKLSPRFVPPAPSTAVMVKAIELPASGFDRCLLRDVFEEVAILERYAIAMLPPVLPGSGSTGQAAAGMVGSPGRPGSTAASGAGGSSSTGVLQGAASNPSACTGVCQLLDYGLTQDAYWIVMRRYRCSLAEWRARQTNGPGVPRAAAVYLGVLLQVVDALSVLAADSVVHFDLKAANVLVEPQQGVSDGQLYGPPPTPPCEPVFNVVLADFGEARAYRSAEEAYTARNRGTEVYKSPEMLLLNAAAANSAQNGAAAGAAGKGVSAAAVLRQGGAGLASDVWSFGCLAYEVLSGRVLFSDADYASVTHRVAFGRGSHLEMTPSERASLEAVGPVGGGAAAASGNGTGAAALAAAGAAAEAGAGPDGSLGMGPQFVALVEWILARDPAARPSLAAIRERLETLRAQCVAHA